MNEETRVFGFAAGLMSLIISPIGLVVFNYYYIFKSEQLGKNSEPYMFSLNALCILGIWGGWKLMIKCSKRH